MTVEEASKLNCPYKPYKTTLDGEPVSTCNPIGCMCWVSAEKIHYVDKMFVKEGESFDRERYPMHVLCGTHTNYSDRVWAKVYGIPKKVESGYCTVRGKDV